MDVILHIMQRMSDVRIPQASCSTNWARVERDGLGGDLAADRSSVYRCYLGAGWHAVGAMGLAAVDDFNARDGRFVHEFGALDGCDKRLNATVFDTGSTEIEAVHSFINMVANYAEASAIVGPARSAAAAAVAPIAAVFQLPVISYWASSIELNNADKYPTFARAFPTDTPAATAICQLWSNMSYTRAAVIYLTEEHGEGYSQDVRTACTLLGVAIDTYTYDSGTHRTWEQIDDQVRRIARSGVRVVHMLVLLREDLHMIVNASIQHGLMGDCDTCGSLFSVADAVTAEDVASLPRSLRNAFHGTLAVYARGGSDRENSRWLDFAAHVWPLLSPQRINSRWPPSFHVADDFFTTYDVATSSTARDNIKAVTHQNHNILVLFRICLQGRCSSIVRIIFHDQHCAREKLLADRPERVQRFHELLLGTAQSTNYYH